ncbi:DUF547 domain-containing protein [Nonlabens ponticola]|uniref:DUF547 domain-containing protein n=1 Tax=Nonlabens ponticola TaxID=2496866 RepID=A0A3S9MUH0_9FLAO|nr:DUF547 domain-containing protein [Nonlabens ponticola]AZQ42822.1 DUF547 domain-containing protein [Nonlabens ponticola]
MKKITYLLLFIFITASCVGAGSLYYDTLEANEQISTNRSQLDHSEYDKLLKRYVNEEGFVDYEGLKKEHAALKSYLTYLSVNPPKKDWENGEQFAYYINLYNAATLDLILDNDMPASIKDISGPLGQVWLKEYINVNGEMYSLASIEKGVLQKMGDPRIHFAINCASYSCPKLMRDAFTGSNVDELMDRAAREFVNSDKNDLSDPANPKLSSIFKFYTSDFTDTGKSLVAYVNQYADQKINTGAKVDFKEYDWSLNDQE